MAIIDSIMEEYYRRKQDANLISESTVLLDSKSSAQIIIDPDPSRNFKTDAYFKFIPDKSIDLMHSARISFMEPRYIQHYSNQYVLTRSDKKSLMRMLTSKATKDKTITGWIAIIREFNRMIKDDVKGNGANNLLSEDLQMPDYMKL